MVFIFLGLFPQELSKLTKLEYLDLSSNYKSHLSGEFPLEVARLPFLTNIYIDGNSFSSNIFKKYNYLFLMFILLFYDFIVDEEEVYEIIDKKLKIMYNF